jgi:hypothetical protein
MVCPLPYDGAFVEHFYAGFNIVRACLRSDAEMPDVVTLPSATHRAVARMLVERRTYRVSEVIEALKTFQQPHLLSTKPSDLAIVSTSSSPLPLSTNVLVVPEPRWTISRAPGLS